MKQICDYCGNYLDSSDEVCPNCGAVNSHLIRTNSETPATIEELKVYCEKNGLTSEKTRFFVGENYTEPKAFGIYKDESTGNFIVYKNKADGSRSIRYEGSDEAYAVNELYMRLKEEILNQRDIALSHPSKPKPKKVEKKIEREVENSEDTSSSSNYSGATFDDDTSKFIFIMVLISIVTIFALVILIKNAEPATPQTTDKVVNETSPTTQSGETTSDIDDDYDYDSFSNNNNRHSDWGWSFWNNDEEDTYYHNWDSSYSNDNDYSWSSSYDYDYDDDDTWSNNSDDWSWGSSWSYDDSSWNDSWSSDSTWDSSSSWDSGATDWGSDW